MAALPRLAVETPAVASSAAAPSMMVSSPAGIAGLLPLQALVFTADASASSTLAKLLFDHGIDSTVARDVRQFEAELIRHKYNLIVFDHDLAGSANPLAKIWNSPSNRKAITIAIASSRNDVAMALKAGAHFCVEKPMHQELTAKSIRAAYGFLLKDRQAYYRHSINVPVHVEGRTGNFEARSMNISEGGVALHFPLAGPACGIVKLIVTLPGLPQPLRMKAHIVWTDASGRAGLQFTEVSRQDKQFLGDWLAQQLHQKVAQGLVPVRIH